jgi:OmpR-family two-component system manganese-sensing sensor histidine kinase
MSTASATVSHPSVRKVDVAPRALERRLLVAYLMVLGVVFVAGALLMHALFVTGVAQQSYTRLQTLARAGLRTAVFKGNRVSLDPHDMANSRLLMLRGQGLAWFDSKGRLLGSQGLAPGPDGPPQDGYSRITSENQTFDTLAIGIVNPANDLRVGTIRASELDKESAASIRWFDVGLLIGTMLALLGSSLAGVALTRNAVKPVVGAFETLRDFTADASHELRSPLAAIASNADAALRDATRNPERDLSRFETIADAAKQMSRLTNDLLLLAVANASLEHDLFVIDLGELVRRVVGRFAARFASAGINLNCTVQRGTTAYGNPDQIERIIANLLENALRFTRRGGSVWVEGIQDRSRLLVKVRDTGVGIPADQLDHVFERFWRADTSRSSEGTGLGLAIARALARRHGGDVTVTSREGIGSEFLLTLPDRPNVAAGLQAGSGPRRSSRPSGRPPAPM